MPAGRSWSPTTRRAFLQRLAAATAAGGWTTGLWTPQRAKALEVTMAQITSPTGTTLESTIVRIGNQGPYFKLGEGPGFPMQQRTELCELVGGRESRRRAVASVVHLTDIHIVDHQSPARVEFIDRHADPPADDLPTVGAYRSQDAMTTHIGASMVTRVNAVAQGPVTGRPFDCAVSTGDNIDNFQTNETRMFFEVLDGLTVTPNSGDPDQYEGVQDFVSFDPAYYHPDEGPADNYKSTYGYPDYPGLLDQAIAPFQSPGLNIPWYSAYGNHDGLLQGNAPTNPVLDGIATGPVKVINSGPGAGIFGDPATTAALLNPATPGSVVRLVTADGERLPLTPAGWVQAHLDSTSSPNGHGYTSEAVETGNLYYTFPVAPGVLGISLDTVNRGGYAEGSLTASQFAWLETRLTEAHSSYLDDAGNTVTTSNEDQIVVLFSHHNMFTLENPFPDPANPEQLVLGDEIRSMVHRFPNMVLWVNGHSHVNRVTPFPDPSGVTGGFWEISTAAHIDHPQQARLIEITDNQDGTLSIFGTIIEHAAAADPDSESDPMLRLAAIGRELAFNEIQTGGNPDAGLGTPNDLNVELCVAAPFTVTPQPSPVAQTTVVAQAPPEALPATGGSSMPTAAVLGSAALGAAVAVRARMATED